MTGDSPLRTRTTPPGPDPAAADAILSPEARAFVDGLVRRFRDAREALLGVRAMRQARVDAGALPDFDPATRALRESEWRVASAPADLLDRRVEITGPPDRKMVINALNSGANGFMVDFEDSLAPTWANVIDGQANVRDAVRRTIAIRGAERDYVLGSSPAVLHFRPRGWHLPEAHWAVDGRPAPAALVDVGLFLFHNADALVAQGSGPYLYLPKLEHGEEALLWDEVLGEAEARLRLARGTIRVTVLIETLPAAFQMEEILWNLRGRICGLNCGRWDYIFSYIKTLAAHPGRCVPDRGSVTMAAPFLQAYSRLLVESCHRRGAHAMGGMAAQVPVKGDPEANERAFARVRADKEREVQNGHDGTWVAHPALVVTARAVFDARMPAENQLDRRPGYVIGRQDLLAHPEGACTGDGAHHNLQVALRYVDAWLGGQGCVQLDGLMEDAATAEISRAQLWQWAHHGAPVDGRPLRLTELHRWLADEAAAARVRPETAALLHDALGAHALPPFLTLPAYALLVGGLSS